MTTWVEIVDTAVKIGLGAIISSITTYLLAKFNFEKDLKKDIKERKMDYLRDSSSTIYKNFRAFRDLSASLMTAKKENFDPANTQQKNLLKKEFENVNQSYENMAEVMGTLRVMGFPEQAQKLKDFSGLLATVQGFYISFVHEGNPLPEVSSLQHLVNRSHDIEEEVFSGLSEEFHKIG